MIRQNFTSEFPISMGRKEHRGKGPIFKKHWHEELRIFYIEAGNAIIHCNSQPIPISAGHIGIINNNDLHYLENCGDRLAESYILLDFVFLGSLKNDACQTKYITPLIQNRIRFESKIEDDGELTCLFLDLIKEYEQKQPGYELAIKAGLYRLLVSLLRRHSVPATGIIKARRHDPLRPVLQYIDEHYDQKLTLQELAAIASISPHHLCRLFKSATGLPPVTYINFLRINAAMQLLQQGKLSVGEVAASVGFNDSNYFSRLFKKYKHLSPTDVQKELSDTEGVRQQTINMLVSMHNDKPS